MRLTVVGCSGSFAGPESPASSYLVQADDPSLGRPFNLVLDLGNGALGPLQRHVDLDDVDAVMLTHLHPDHCVDLCGLYVQRKYRQGGAPDQPLPVYGPPATRARVAAFYEGLGSQGMTTEFHFVSLADRAEVQVGPFSVTPFRVNHPIEAYGFRVEADGTVLSYSGDTDTCEALSPLLVGATLALLDSAFVDGRDDSPGVHLSGSRAARAALDATGVRRLMLTHIPPWNDPEVCRRQAAEIWPGEVEMAEPGATYEL